MGFFTKLKNGWNLGLMSLGVIRKNKDLLLFPLLSGISLMIIVSTFIGGILVALGVIDNANGTFLIEGEGKSNEILAYAALFVLYFINYTVIVFFNIGLIHCVRIYFKGTDPSVMDGIKYSFTRMGSIFLWALLAASVGLVLRIIEDKNKQIGAIVAGLLGMLWSVITYFVVPVIAYENVTPFQAIKRSGELIKRTWGESIGANFSFGLFYLLGILIAVLVGIGLSMIEPLVGIIAGILIFVLVVIITSAAETVFIAAVYQHISNEPVKGFDSELLDQTFTVKA